MTKLPMIGSGGLGKVALVELGWQLRIEILGGMILPFFVALLRRPAGRKS